MRIPRHSPAQPVGFLDRALRALAWLAWYGLLMPLTWVCHWPMRLYTALLALADVDRLEPARLVEQVMEQYVVDRVHAAMVIAQRVDVAGLSRLRPVSPGSARIEPVLPGFARTSPDAQPGAGGKVRP